ncbi:MAG TPA: AarF/ABC1/UbiB kinase family protein [Chitinophagaceae bacterium]|jgi:ubiquinone biosynthesis protein|nr:AarF/ABC1/UbiB kinase family protein [Chitinophagaceae bacterium]
MWIFQIARFFRNFFRLIAIFFITLKHVAKNWMYNTWLRRIFDPKGKRLTSRAEQLRQTIEELGPTFVKFGQIVADRPDLASDHLREELKKLQSNARPMDDGEAISLIETELGDPIDEVFLTLEKRHIASASIAQVYSGVLRTGERVAIKIQRPNIKNKIEIDLILMKILAKQVVKTYPGLTSFNLIGFVEDFGENLMKELDFNNEASNMLRFTDMFKDDPSCYIPKVFIKYSRQRLLVMEYIEGLRPDDIDGLRSAGFDPQVIAVNGTHIILKMILRHGFFHADPHPGNIFIRGDNQIVLLDHGMAASLKPRQIQALINFMLGFSKNDPHRIAKSLLSLSEITYFKEMEDIEFRLGEIIKKYSYMSYEQVDISAVMAEAFRVIGRYGLRVPSNLFTLIKSLATIQKFAENLQADVSIANMIRPYATEKIKEQFSWDALVKIVTDSAEDYLYIVSKLPKDIREVVGKLKDGVMRHEINFSEDSFTNKAFRMNINRLAFVFILGLMMICSTMLMIYMGDKQIIRIFFYTTLTITTFTALRLLAKTR